MGGRSINGTACVWKSPTLSFYQPLFAPSRIAASIFSGLGKSFLFFVNRICEYDFEKCNFRILNREDGSNLMEPAQVLYK